MTGLGIMSRTAILFAALAMWALPIAPSGADQNDPRLDRLFTELKLAADQASADDIAAEIWALWRKTDNPVAAQSLADGSEAIGIHPVGNLTLTWDHRAFDGAYAAAFLKHTKDLLETMDWEQELS